MEDFLWVLSTIINAAERLTEEKKKVAQVKNLLAMQGTWVQSLSWEDPLKKGKATHSSILAWKNSMDCIVHGVTKSQDTTELLSHF